MRPVDVADGGDERFSEVGPDIRRSPIAAFRATKAALGQTSRHWVEERTDGNEEEPLFGMCCMKGQIRLPPLSEPPDALRELLEGHTREAAEFRDNIAQYNAALAFTSVGVDVDERVNHVGRGPPVFRIHGELRHRSGALLPRENDAPVYSQLYLLDPHAALQYRMQRNGNLDEHTMAVLQNMLRQVNPYVGIYLHAYEVLTPRNSDFEVHLRLRPGQDRRRYNLPRVEEVAVLLPDRENGEQPDSRDIILRLRIPAGEYPLQRVSERNAAYAPLHYVLLFPY
ncbi:hypothetical protein EV121DRAFT_297743, partial [Schizophyllum commune]